ncbi:MAG: hypothetical protein NWF03_03115 [Candidatus Bathyarchaeota archaeon]|nr:hypothetical protein [Candidatus Bathyarchaeota archaeon]
MKCPVCERDTKHTYCVRHETAYQNLVEKYEIWKHAVGASFKEYLNSVVENSYTGAWAKEVAQQLLNKEDE